MKKIKIEITEGQLNTIRIALFEYMQICFDQGTEMKNGQCFSIEDKKSCSYKLGKSIDKVLNTLSEQGR